MNGPTNKEAYRRIIALVADEIWLRNGGRQEYCTLLRPGVMAKR